MIELASPTGVSKITRGYQVSIPPEVREKLNLKGGDFIAFFEDESNKEVYYIKKVTI